MNIFSHKELVPAAPSGNGQVEQTANPYLDARRQSNSQIDRAFGSLHVWQLIAVASLLIALACVAGIIYFGSQTKYVPYVIEVDKLGEAVAVGPAQLAAPADPRVVRASLASFIAAARLVTPDLEVQRKAIFLRLRHAEDQGSGDRKNERIFERDAGNFAVYTLSQSHGEHRHLNGTPDHGEHLGSRLAGDDAGPRWKLSWTTNNNARHPGDLHRTSEHRRPTN